MLLWAAFLGFCIFWVVYWRVIFTYTTHVKLATVDEHFNEEVAARLVGHMSNLFCSLLLFPVSRTGLWVDVFGVPYDRLIKYHRLLGLIGYVFVTLHAWIWWNKWASEGHLGDNIATINSLYVSSAHVAFQDFSILLAEMAWLLITVSLLMAVLLRRKLYSWFQYTHKYFGIIFYVTAIFHAWALW